MIQSEIVDDIRKYHKQARDIGMQMIKDEFGGDMNKATQDMDFIRRMHHNIDTLWNKYLDSYRLLEKIEKENGYASMKQYADILDIISEYIPDQCKQICYYPFAGIDFYWARIFNTLICQDITYDRYESLNAWWGMDWYNGKKRMEIVELLKSIEIIPPENSIICVNGKAELPNKETELNRHEVTLLLKGGHSVIDFIKERFNDQVFFGIIIIVTPADTIEDLDGFMSYNGYNLIYHDNETRLLIPYAMELRDIHVFSKKV